MGAAHFLWHMVRRMVGVLVEVGMGTMEPETVLRFLNGMAQDTRKFTAPAHGLFFEKAFYRQEELESFLAERPEATGGGGQC